MFVLCVCADVLGVKHNMEIAFPLKPSMDELQAEVERLFRTEIWAQDRSSSEDFTVARFMIYQGATQRWAELKHSSQLKPLSQLYATQNKFGAGHSAGVPPVDDSHISFPDDDEEEYEAMLRQKDRERARERERERDRDQEQQRQRERERILMRERHAGPASERQLRGAQHPDSAVDHFSPPPPSARYTEPERRVPAGVYPPPSVRGMSISPRAVSPPPPVRPYPRSPRMSVASPNLIIEEQSLLTHGARLQAERQSLLVQEAQLARERDEFIARTGRRPGELVCPASVQEWEVNPFRQYG